MSGEAIYVALTSGKMQAQAKGLNTAQIFALLGYIAPTGGATAAPPNLERTCKSTPALRADVARDWSGWSPLVTNSRFQNAGGLTAADVPKLKLKWAFNLGQVINARAQPAVVGGRLGGPD